MSELLGTVITALVNTVGNMGYTGIIVLMFLESSFFPFPSEVVMPPAGYLACTGALSLPLVLMSGVAGSLLGALFNYWLSFRFGRPFFLKYGRHFGVTESVLDKADIFFERHGHISTFIGRLVPVIRQYISLPAGIAGMNLNRFCLYTSLGAGIWVAVLTMLGYWLGRNQTAIHEYLSEISVLMLILCGVIATLYTLRTRHRTKKSNS